MLAKFIEQLEKQIILVQYELDNYIGRKDWHNAGKQRSYIDGINLALHLARANYIEQNECNSL